MSAKPITNFITGSGSITCNCVVLPDYVDIFAPNAIIVPNAKKLDVCYKGLPCKPEGLDLPKVSLIDDTVYGNIDSPDIEFKENLNVCKLEQSFDKLTPERISLLESMGWDVGGLS